MTCAWTVAVEGVIGVGKTTLTKALAAKLGAETMLESGIANPFLEDFYLDPPRYRLACQLWFLEGRLRQMERPRLSAIPLVCDYILQKDKIFAAVNLEEAEWELYLHLFDRLAPRAPPGPDVVIYLKAGHEEILRRIRRRGRPVERYIDHLYLEALVSAYDEYFDSVQDRPVVVVDTDANNFAEDGDALDRLLGACTQAPKGLSYCNPVG